MCVRACAGPLTYLQTYNRYYGVQASKVDEEVLVHLDELEACCVRVRRRVLSHLLRAIASQTKFEQVTPRTRARVREHARLAHLASVSRLRSLQRRIAVHLWRPGAGIARRHAHTCAALFLR